MITSFKIFEKKFNQEPIKVGNFVYHSSNPINRKSILEKGLIPRIGDQRLGVDIEYSGIEAVFASNTEDKELMFHSYYDDDVYKIHTTKIPNITWYTDYNMGDASFGHPHIVTFNPIPPEAIELIHKGKGKNLLEGVVTPKTQVQDEIDRLMDKGFKNLTPEEMEFLKNPHKKQKPQNSNEKPEILKYYQIAEEFFRSVVGRDIRNFDLNDNLDLWDIMNSEEEVYHVGNTIYYKYGVQIDPENNNDFKLVNIFKKIYQKIKK